MQKTGTDIELAANIIKEGGLVAFPTETVYGLGANALNPIAVARIFEAKERPSFDPLIVHISDINQLNDIYELPVNKLVYKLAHKFWPGPLTIVHQKSKNISGIVTADLDTVAVRMPSHPIALELLKLSNCPIAAPSANKFGQLSPTSHEHVAKQNMPLDYILQGAEIVHGIESTVVYIENNDCSILRPGVITLEDIKEIIPQAKYSDKNKNDHLPSPGLLNSHYSPKKPLYFLPETEKIFLASTGVILHSDKHKNIEAGRVIYSSEKANLIEVAANIFKSLHEMEDDSSIKEIYVESVPEIGIGIAIMDRLKKACYRYNSK